MSLTQRERGSRHAVSGSRDVREAGPPLYRAPRERYGWANQQPTAPWTSVFSNSLPSPPATPSDRLCLPVLVCGEPLTILRFTTSPPNYMVGSPRGGITSYASSEIPQSIQHNSENRGV